MTDVLHVISGLGTGGAETMLVQLASGLQATGLDQHVVSVSGSGPRAEELGALGIAVTALGIRSVFDGPGGLFRLTRLIGRLRPRLVQGWMYHGDLFAALAHRLAPGRRGRGLFWNLRASNVDEERYAGILNWNVRLSSWPDVVIANSAAGVAHHVARGYRPRRVEVIANGVDAEKFRPDAAARASVRRELGISDDAIVAIHAARVDVMKDHALFLAAIAAAPDICGVMVGAGTENLACPPNVRALGLRNDMPALYAAADIVVSTSAFAEGFSNAIAEGMSAGLVPVATDVGDARVLIGETGQVVPPRDSEALHRALANEASVPPQVRQARGAAARRRVMEQFTLAKAVDAYARLYAEYATGQGALAPIGRSAPTGS